MGCKEMKSIEAKETQRISQLGRASLFLSGILLLAMLFSCGPFREVPANTVQTQTPTPEEVSPLALTPPAPEPTPEATPKASPMTRESQMPSPTSLEASSPEEENEVPTGDWALILINPTHFLAEDFKVALADFETGQVDARIADTCERMFAHAKKDGVSFQLVDAYRTYDRQNQLYQKKVQSYVDKGYSRVDAEIEAATITARPNTSEHQTGLALDIVSPSYRVRDGGFAKTEAFLWLKDHAHEYGFTMRYPENKISMTGVIYEPWHWRFVGVEAASSMKESGQCLEEYLEDKKAG